MQLVWIGALGILGVFSRFFLDQLAVKISSPFPWGTFLINLSGSFLAGLAYSLSVERGLLPPELRTAVMVGFLGGFTTFSAFSLQAARLLESGSVKLSLFYLIGSPALGIVCALLGLVAGRKAS